MVEEKHEIMRIYKSTKTLTRIVCTTSNPLYPLLDRDDIKSIT